MVVVLHPLPKTFNNQHWAFVGFQNLAGRSEEGQRLVSVWKKLQRRSVDGSEINGFRAQDGSVSSSFHAFMYPIDQIRGTNSVIFDVLRLGPGNSQIYGPSQMWNAIKELGVVFLADDDAYETEIGNIEVRDHVDLLGGEFT
ncbi:hypothetical protein VNO78_03227 [Psophocarpus tetragonolobus]|uniref:Uncharacterized protein n=1 Tax=Psophocarpus tetragonolobus TaxID=3891 RepID=A0AAN9T161_PSOTE